ncbi:MAG: hypothetical protein ACREDE_03640 [Thermoplasmata archaeon]
MSFVRLHKRILKDGTTRTYFARVENVWENGRVRQHVIEYLGTSPAKREIRLDPALAANVALALIEGKPTAAVAAERLRNLGLDLPGRPKQFSLTYNPPLRRYTLRVE